MKNKADILEKRLSPLSEYIELTIDGANSGKSFARFLEERGISKEDFISELPDKFKNPPANNIDDLISYTLAMSKMYSEMNKDRNVSILGADGITDGDSLPMGRFYNGDGLGVIDPADDADNWVEAVTYDGSSEATLRRALGRAWEMLAEWARQIDVKQGEGDSQAVVRLGMQMDDTALIIDWITKRLEGKINAQIARQAFEERHHYRRGEWEAYLKNSANKPKNTFFSQLKTTLNQISSLAKQDWKSIVAGLKKSPKEILDDLKREAQKDIKDSAAWIQKNINIHNANRYNPIFVLARRGFRTLLEMNIFGLAWNFNRIMNDSNQSYWSKITQKWDNMGGEKSDLIKSINAGKGKTPIIYKLKNLKINFNADGENKPAIITASVGTLTAATPVIVNAIAAGTISPAVSAALLASGGVITAMAPVMVAFGKSKGENPTGSEEDQPIGEGQMPPPPGGPDNNGGLNGEPVPVGVKVAIGGAIGLSILIISGLLIFGGNRGK